MENSAFPISLWTTFWSFSWFRISIKLVKRLGSQSYIRGIFHFLTMYSKLYATRKYTVRVRPPHYIIWKIILKTVGTTPNSLKVHYFKYKPMSCSTYIILSFYKYQILLYLKVGHNSYGLKMVVDKQDFSDFPPLRDHTNLFRNPFPTVTCLFYPQK